MVFTVTDEKYRKILSYTRESFPMATEIMQVSPGKRGASTYILLPVDPITAAFLLLK
jgi:hypothetical protein